MKRQTLVLFIISAMIGAVVIVAYQLGTIAGCEAEGLVAVRAVWGYICVEVP